MKLRIPGWARNEAIPGNLYRFEEKIPEDFSLLLNGDTIITEIHDGYVSIDKVWVDGDKLKLFLPMPVRLVTSDEMIKDNLGKVAVQRGPVIYCV
jgi:DUF1680 family protein